MCVCVLKVIYLQASGVMYLFSDSTCESFLLLFFLRFSQASFQHCDGNAYNTVTPDKSPVQLMYAAPSASCRKEKYYTERS